LKDVRGKIVLLRRFPGGPDVGFDLTYWPENQHFRSATTLIYDVEDRYQDPGEDDKYNFILDHIKKARNGGLRDLYITFSSAVNLRAVAMDYFEKPQELVPNVIKTNWCAGRPAVTPSRRA
ncbi:MAG: hypothetical protein WBF76_02740, partial [Pseudonocardiaceae bacterium]